MATKVKGTRTRTKANGAPRTPTKKEIEAAINGEDGDSGDGLRHRLQHAMSHCTITEHETMTGVRLAKETKTSSVMVWRYLAGRRYPSPETVWTLARRLGCLPGWLMFGGRHGRPGSIEAVGAERVPIDYGTSPSAPKGGQPRRRR